MKVYEYAKEKGKTTGDVLVLLGDPKRSHMSNLTDEEIDILDAVAPVEETEIAEETGTDTEKLIADLTGKNQSLKNELASEKNENVQLTEQVSEKQKQIDDLHEEIELLSGGVLENKIDQTEQKRINAECQKLLEGLSQEEIDTIITNITCMGNKSKHWEKYSILLQQK